MMPCPVCGSQNSIDVFKANDRPRYALQRHTSRQSALQCEKEDVDFVFCVDCQFAYNRIFHPATMDYQQDIETSRSCSEYFNNYIVSVCKQLDKILSVRKKVLIEIGCGDGQFLIELRKLYKYEGWGFDPSLIKSKKLPAYKDLRFVSDYYNRDCLSKQPDIIILRHVLEHIADPKDFLTPIISNQNAHHSGIYVEVPDWEWIVDNDQVMMFSNDHCSYYSKNSLEWVLSSFGFRCEQLSVAFEDEYLQYFGRESSSNGTPKSLSNNDLHIKGYSAVALIDKTVSFIGRIPKVLDRFKSYFTGTSNDAVLWGAGGKGSILLPTLGVSYEQLPFVVDSNPNKQNTYIPVTGQQIIPPSQLKFIQPRYVLITNPNYRGEIASQLDSLGVNAKIIPIK